MSLKATLKRLIVPAASVVLVLLLQAPAEAGAPAVATSVAWGWATARQPTVTDYSPAPKDRGNSTAHGVHIHRLGVGVYKVTFRYLGAEGGGTVQAGALGRDRVCNVGEWGTGQGPTLDVVVIVFCFTRTGSPADAKYVVDYMRATGTGGKLGYLLADQPTATDYTPAPETSYNSGGFANGVHRSGTGLYVVDFSGLDVGQGSVQVSAYASVAAYCRAVGWVNDTGSVLITIRCRDFAGAPVDSLFDVTFMQDMGLKGPGTPAAAYLRADRPTTASYHPDAAFRYSTAGHGALVTRLGRGAYAVPITDMPLGGAALVTAYGSGKIRCMVGGIRTSGSQPRIVVHCYDLAGALADGKFTLAFAR